MNNEIMKRAMIEMCFNLNKTLAETTKAAIEAKAIPAEDALDFFSKQTELLISMFNSSGIDAYRGMEKVIMESDFTRWRDENKMLIFKEMLSKI